MGKATKNILILLGILSIGFAGYYLYTERNANSLLIGSNSEAVTNMLNNTQVFIERNRTLGKITLDISLLEDERFTALRGFSGPPTEVPVGRPDPFAGTSPSPVTSTTQ